MPQGNESAIKQLKDHIKRLEMTPHHDPIVLKKLREKLKEMQGQTYQGSVSSQVEKLQKRNKVLKGLSN
jgi:hypothetical protein